MIKKISAFILSFVIIFLVPILVMAAGKIVPECGVVVNGVIEHQCNFNYLMILINNVITFLLITMATPLFALIIIYVAWLYLSASGNTENVGKAKKILKNAIFGYVIALAAWLIVKTILSSLGFKGPLYLG
jgi:hypothetical protein